MLENEILIPMWFTLWCNSLVSSLIQALKRLEKSIIQKFHKNHIKAACFIFLELRVVITSRFKACRVAWSNWGPMHMNKLNWVPEAVIPKKLVFYAYLCISCVFSVWSVLYCSVHTGPQMESIARKIIWEKFTEKKDSRSALVRSACTCVLESPAESPYCLIYLNLSWSILIYSNLSWSRPLKYAQIISFRTSSEQQICRTLSSSSLFLTVYLSHLLFHLFPRSCGSHHDFRSRLQPPNTSTYIYRARFIPMCGYSLTLLPLIYRAPQQ